MRKEMKHIYKYAIAAAFFAGVTSCTSLEEELNDRATDKIIPNNSVGARNNLNVLPPADGLASAFVKLNDGSATNGGFFAVQEGGTDEAVITQKVVTGMTVVSISGSTITISVLKHGLSTTRGVMPILEFTSLIHFWQKML